MKILEVIKNAVKQTVLENKYERYLKNYRSSNKGICTFDTFAPMSFENFVLYTANDQKSVWDKPELVKAIFQTESYRAYLSYWESKHDICAYPPISYDRFIRVGNLEWNAEKCYEYKVHVRKCIIEDIEPKTYYLYNILKI